MDYSKFKLLLVDDEPDILEFLSYNLSNKGFVVIVANDGLEAIEKAKKELPDLILLDVMMPGMDGIEVCEKLREDKALEHTIIAFLTARGEDYSQIAGFEAGGDDYIQKPIRPKVLISRIEALLKRYQKSVNSSEVNDSDSDTIVERKNLKIDKERYLVLKEDKELVLPKKEFELLLLLVSKPDKVFTREQIFQTVWGEDVIVTDRTIDVHIRKLREKIGDEMIVTVKGVGYKYTE